MSNLTNLKYNLQEIESYYNGQRHPTQSYTVMYDQARNHGKSYKINKKSRGSERSHNMTAYVCVG